MLYGGERHHTRSPDGRLIVEPLAAWHLIAMRQQRDIQDEQAQFQTFLTNDRAIEIASGVGYAGVRDGRVIGCAGVHEHQERPGVAIAWALMTKNAGRSMIAATRRIAAFLDTCSYHRVEIYVRRDFEQGMRWARLLKMTCEAELLRKWDAEGNDYALFARVT